MGSFSPYEATIADVQTAIKERHVTAKEVVNWYLQRIEMYDQTGSALHAVVTVNERAVEDAGELDDYYFSTGKFKGPLHGVPVLVKDQVETGGLRTSFGSRAFKDYIPAKDATIIQRLREAGAILLAKTSMCDLAAGWFSFSSMTDYTKNPYDLDREPGGSSSGTCAGIAANFGLVGIGEDTGGSIRLPASFNNLVGLRVTTGLISRKGLSPLVHFQDTPGPIARTVQDVAKLLDVLVGYDPGDSYTVAALMARDIGSYAANLDGLLVTDMRLGVLRTAFGLDDTDAGPVNKAVDGALDQLKLSGAILVDPIDISNLQEWILKTSLYTLQSKADINRFLKQEDRTVHSFEDIYSNGLYHSMNDLFHDIANGPQDPEVTSEYYRLRLNQEDFRRMLMNRMAYHHVDVLVFPTVQVIPPLRSELRDGKWSTLNFPTNTVIASQSGLPAVSVSVGFTEAGIPVGMELVGMPHSELHLLQMAYRVEQILHPRMAPNLFREKE